MKYRDQKTIIYIAVAIIVILGMLFGTLYDLEITKSLALDVDGAGNYSLKQNTFFKVLSVFGIWILPCILSFCLSVIGCLFLKSKNKKNGNIVLIISIVSLLLSITLMAYASIKTMKQFTITLEPLHYVVAIITTLVMTFLSFFVVFFQTKENLVKKLPQAFSTLIVGVALLIIVELLFKMVIGRIRPSALVELGSIDANFVPWYSIHPSAKDAFHSFPSSCVTYITFALSLCLFIPNYKINSRSYFIYNILMVLFIVLFMIGGICSGNHYLSDVAFGAGLGYIACEINKFVYCKFTEQKMYL